MVTEGTRISDPSKDSLSEADVESKFRDIYTNADGLVLNWFSPLNVDRWVSAYRALGKNRCFVHDLYTEFLHYLIKRQIPSIPLEQEAKNLRVFCPPNQVKRLEYKGIRKFVEKTRLEIEFDLTPAIHPPKERAMLFRPSMLNSVFHGAFSGNTELIVSLWPGYTRNEIFETVEKAIHHCGGKVHYVHASGHIYAKDLIGLIQDINPKKLIPVHTEHPESFLDEFPQAHLAHDGEAIHV
jgi:ribonuclease J